MRNIRVKGGRRLRGGAWVHPKWSPHCYERQRLGRWRRSWFVRPDSRCWKTVYQHFLGFMLMASERHYLSTEQLCTQHQVVFCQNPRRWALSCENMRRSFMKWKGGILWRCLEGICVWKNGQERFVIISYNLIYIGMFNLRYDLCEPIPLHFTGSVINTCMFKCVKHASCKLLMGYDILDWLSLCIKSHRIAG